MADEVMHDGGAEEEEVRRKSSSISKLKIELLFEAPKASDAIEFYKAAFDAVEKDRKTRTKPMKSGMMMMTSATLQVSGIDSGFFSVRDFVDKKSRVLRHPVGLMLFLKTEDVEAAIQRAKAAGAVDHATVPVTNSSQTRWGMVKDPFGFIWTIFSDPPKTDRVNVENEAIDPSTPPR